MDTLRSSILSAVASVTNVAGAESPACKGDDCTPSIESAGKDVTVSALGGRAVFKTKDCDEVDVCNLAKMVDAIADGLGKVTE